MSCPIQDSCRFADHVGDDVSGATDFAYASRTFAGQYGGGIEILCGDRGPDIHVALAFLKRANNAVLRRFIEAAVDTAARQ